MRKLGRLVARYRFDAVHEHPGGWRRFDAGHPIRAILEEGLDLALHDERGCIL